MPAIDSHDMNASSFENMRPCATLSKKRYDAIGAGVRELVHDATVCDAIMRHVCEVMNFDPSLPTYTDEVKIKSKAAREKKMAEHGKSTYELTRAREYYLANKERLNARRTENARLKRELAANVPSDATRV